MDRHAAARLAMTSGGLKFVLSGAKDQERQELRDFEVLRSAQDGDVSWFPAVRHKVAQSPFRTLLYSMLPSGAATAGRTGELLLVGVQRIG